MARNADKNIENINQYKPSKAKNTNNIQAYTNTYRQMDEQIFTSYI